MLKDKTTLINDLWVELGEQQAESLSGGKSDVCHKTASGSYVKIRIPDPAYPAHVAHGDASPGQEVPGMTGSIFNLSCVPIPNPCSPNPCENGGTCSVDGENFVCTCPPEWTGERCEIEIPPPPP